MTGHSETATQLDDAIDALLEGRDGPRSLAEGELTLTARVLHEALPRFHPRFSFEDHLAARLAVLTRPSTPVASAPPIPIRPDLVQAAAEQADAVAAAERRRRGLVAGGAIASGVSLAIPIAGAAFVVWRRSRSSGGLL